MNGMIEITKKLLRKSQYVIKNYNNESIVWFKESNQWVFLNQNNSILFNEYLSNTPLNTIQKKHPCVTSSPSEIENIFESFHYLNNKENFKQEVSTTNSIKNNETFNTINYIYQDKCFSISYPSEKLYQYIHPCISHLKGAEQIKPSHCIILEKAAHCFAIKTELSEWQFTETDAQIKRLLFIKLSEYFYQKNNTDWLAFLHASAVVKNEHLLLFSSPSGSGKSTIAGLLVKEQYAFFSDDFVPITLEEKLAYPFPALLSAKNDGIEIYKQLKFEPYCQIKNKFSFYKSSISIVKPMRPKNIIFVYYDESKETFISNLSKIEAIQLLLKETYVIPEIKHIQHFLEWTDSLSFYLLSYSNNEKAIHFLEHIIEK